MQRATATALSLWTALCVLTPGCRDSADARPSLVRSAQILAVAAEPAEVAPSGAVTYHVLSVDENGPLSPQDLSLSYCQTPKSLGDNRVASDACARAVERELPIERLPNDACTRFGPAVPAGTRPPDPDASGGYYQPVRVAFDDVLSVAMQRIRCSLTNVPIALGAEFRERYVPNTNPALTPVTVELDGETQALDALPRDRELILTVGWSDSSREPYVVYDSDAVTLVERDESLRVSWFVTAGELTYDYTGSAGSERKLQTTNRWRSPDYETTVFLWVVLRDDRGGVSWGGYELSVR